MDEDNENYKFDSLSEFHLHNPETIAYELLEEIVENLKNVKPGNEDQVFARLQDLLTDVKSAKLLKFICEKHGVNYDRLVHLGEGAHKFTPPKLLLHMVCYLGCYKSMSYVADKLGIDSREASQLYEQLTHNFTIDDPLLWLDRLRNQTVKEKKYHQQCKQKLLHGHDVVNQPKDTAEDRKAKIRRRFISFFKFW